MQNMKRKVKIILSIAVSVAAALLAVIIVLICVNRSYKDKSEDSYLSDTASDFSSVQATVSEEAKDFEMYTPNSNSASTTENVYTFSGKANTAYPLTLNGEPVELSEDGLFSVTVELQIGKNTFTFVHNDISYVYTINYRFVILKSYSPSKAQTCSSGSILSVSAKARKGSTVTATFNGETITLKEYVAQEENTSASDSEIFADYIGSFTLPSVRTNTNLGKITFKATFEGRTETFSSGNITCKKAEIPVVYDPNAAPLGGNYINVGTGKIAEIVAYEAETFDAYSTNDWSRPTNNYLPEGTVDYSAQGYIYHQSSTPKEYVLLRCGRQVYTTRKIYPTKEVIPVIKEYAGTLPDHNEIKISSFTINKDHTVLTLDTMWKAPFYFDLLPQNYTNAQKQDYTFSNATYNYVDITLCYATVLEGSITIPESNPIFSSAKIIKNQSDYTIRLYLKKQGAFYGWDSHYNSNGQLVFEFLNPTKVSASSNYYGVDLTGADILLDVGHGGIDPGAIGFNSAQNSEAVRNLILAQKIKAELESIGATVHMTRTSNTTSTGDGKIRTLKKLKPDFCVAIHHDASNYSSPNGYGTYYWQPFSKKAAELIHMHTVNTGIYKKSKIACHTYYMVRSSYCPVVLTENGFITNTYDYANIISDSANSTKAKAIVKGIAEYFLMYSPAQDFLIPEEPPQTPTEPEVTPPADTPSDSESSGDNSESSGSSSSNGSDSNDTGSDGTSSDDTGSGDTSTDGTGSDDTTTPPSSKDENDDSSSDGGDKNNDNKNSSTAN